MSFLFLGPNKLVLKLGLYLLLVFDFFDIVVMADLECGGKGDTEC